MGGGQKHEFYTFDVSSKWEDLIASSLDPRQDSLSSFDLLKSYLQHQVTSSNTLSTRAFESRQSATRAARLAISF
jgi:hypothetical protein